MFMVMGLATELAIKTVLFNSLFYSFILASIVAALEGFLIFLHKKDENFEEEKGLNVNISLPEIIPELDLYEETNKDG